MAIIYKNQYRDGTPRFDTPSKPFYVMAHETVRHPWMTCHCCEKFLPNDNDTKTGYCQLLKITVDNTSTCPRWKGDFPGFQSITHDYTLTLDDVWRLYGTKLELMEIEE